MESYKICLQEYSKTKTENGTSQWNGEKLYIFGRNNVIKSQGLFQMSKDIYSIIESI